MDWCVCVCVCVCERERERERKNERQSSMVGLYSRWHNRIANLQDWFFETDTTCTPQILQVFIGFLSGHHFTGLDWKKGTSLLCLF